MRWIRRLVVIGLIVAVWYFGWQFAAENQDAVDVHLVAGELRGVALWKLLLSSFAAGAGVILAYHLYTSARNGLTSRRYRKTIGGLEAEVHELRNLPLSPEASVPAGKASEAVGPPVAAAGSSD